ncbi:MAG: hypothetical protein NZ839_02125, partial [Endomicrobia bacterium]|nr:hypothetical protein [Endomicrobiia bacterium]
METNNRTREEKKVLREKFIKLRENIPEDEANKRSLLIIQQLLKLKNFNQAKNIMLYYPFRNEVNVTGLIDTCKDKTFYFPVVDFDNKTLVIRKY